jgi:SAM-dependent methyltransferase
VRFDDPAAVRTEYADERRLEGRKAAYRFSDGPDARLLVVEAVAERVPRRVLDVGCGTGDLAQMVADRTGAEVTAIDQSPRMVELARARGVDARVADAAGLPFPDAAFDCVVAAWMLFHVPDLDRVLAEIVRVLADDGRLVAATNSEEHGRELYELFGVEHEPLPFRSENGEALLRSRFAQVARRDAFGWVTFPSRAEAQAFVDSSIVLAGRQLPEIEGPLRVRRTPTVFAADR